MKEITPTKLKSLIDNGADIQIIDVREPHEYDICNLGGVLIPLSTIPESFSQIDRTKQVIVHCRSGARSGQAVAWLEKNHGFTNLLNLKGGILAWSSEVDPDFPKY